MAPGLRGPLVLRNVGEVSRLETEPAIVLLQLTVEDNVKGHLLSYKNATLTLAEVCSTLQ